MRTVFVNGCFDILHRGHIELFKYAKSLGDYLLVAIDSDERIKEHKGPRRPHNNIGDRKAVLSSIKFIDEVTCFASDVELEEIVKKLAPDNMIVGSDWQGKKAPVPILRETKTEIRPGMSANVVENLKSFGISIFHITNERLLRKHRFIDDRFKQHMLRVDEGEGQASDRVDTEEIRSFTDLIDAVIISDYDKGFLLSSDCQEITRYFKNKPVFVDSKKSNLSCFENSIIKINKKEHEKSTSISDSSEVIVTLGPNGALYNNQAYDIEEVEVYDVFGAGDVFLSALVYKFMLTKSLHDGIIFANRCASYSVTKFGTYALSRKEIDDLCV